MSRALSPSTFGWKSTVMSRQTLSESVFLEFGGFQFFRDISQRVQNIGSKVTGWLEWVKGKFLSRIHFFRKSLRFGVKTPKT